MQRYKRLWKRLTKKYLKYKKAAGLSPQIWEATELLKESIGAWRVYAPDAFVIGIKSTVYYPTEDGKKVRVLDVARWMEYGTGEQAEGGKGKKDFRGMPPRPLFRPLKDRLSKDLGRHYKSFIDIYHEEIDELLAATALGAEITDKDGVIKDK